MTKSGMTLTELLTVMAIMAMLIGIAVPAARAILESFETSAGVTTVISAALANARAIALSNPNSQYLAGVRFQQDLRGNQYMILIERDEVSTGLVNGFVAIQGRKPMRLPGNIGLMDLYLVDRDYRVGDTPLIDPTVINRNNLINQQEEINDTTTFSIIFTPSGKLITQQVQVRNRDGYTGNNTSTDDVFNTFFGVVTDGVGLFIDDGYHNRWDPAFGGDDEWAWGPENSRKGFIIYNKNDLNKVSPGRRWSNYLRNLDVLYVNPHSGRIIN